MIEKLNKNKITTDWLNFFPDFVKYKPMHLIRRMVLFYVVYTYKHIQVIGIMR